MVRDWRATFTVLGVLVAGLLAIAGLMGGELDVALFWGGVALATVLLLRPDR